MSGPLSNAHTVTKLPAQDLENTLTDLRARGVAFERFEMSGFGASGDTIAAPD